LIIFNALHFCFAICALYTQNKQWMSIFVVELATREDSHKNNEKQPVTLCGVLTLSGYHCIPYPV
jgi:hypothetical protein